MNVTRREALAVMGVTPAMALDVFWPADWHLPTPDDLFLILRGERQAEFYLWEKDLGIPMVPCHRKGTIDFEPTTNARGVMLDIYPDLFTLTVAGQDLNDCMYRACRSLDPLSPTFGSPITVTFCPAWRRRNSCTVGFDCQDVAQFKITEVVITRNWRDLTRSHTCYTFEPMENP